MNILILHRIPYYKVEYNRSIDHQKHDVVYIGKEKDILNIPNSLRCKKIIRPGENSVEKEVISIIENENINFDIVISLSEYELRGAAVIREYFNIPGKSVKDTDLVRDKILMKECVKNIGIAVPRNMYLIDFLNSKNLLWLGKIVLKPIDGASSENIKVFDNIDDLRIKVRNKKTGIYSIDQGVIDGFEVEEFIEGNILHIDGIVKNNEIKLIIPSRYIGTCLDFANGYPLGSVQIEASESLIEWSKKVLEAVKLSDGSFHLEVIESKNQLVFLEVGNRVGGADVVAATEYISGVHLPSAEINAYLNIETIFPTNNFQGKKAGWFVFPGHHIENDTCLINYPQHLETSQYVVRWNKLSSYEKLNKSITYQANEVPLAGLISGKNTDELEYFLNNLFSTVTIV